MRQARRGLHRDLGGDPAADPGADDGHLAQIKRIEQIEVEIGEIIDGVELGRNLGAAVTGMRRRDDARTLGKTIECRAGAVETDFGMEEQQRPAAY
jgi:hypothetical protein